jgi:CubicO group peptidase (beta-lactamase class C family)
MRPLLLPLALATVLLAPATALAAPASKAEVARAAQTLLAENYRSDGPGAVLLVARGDEVLFRGARGQADLDKRVPLTADGMFEIGSVSKQFAAAGLLKLVEAGKVGLDDPLSKYVKDFPNGEHITVRELLNHTSGVKSYTGISGYMMGPLIQRDLTTAQLIDVFKTNRRISPLAPPSATTTPATCWSAR